MKTCVSSEKLSLQTAPQGDSVVVFHVVDMTPVLLSPAGQHIEKEEDV